MEQMKSNIKIVKMADTIKDSPTLQMQRWEVVVFRVAALSKLGQVLKSTSN
jgi:hypothetical protein